MTAPLPAEAQALADTSPEAAAVVAEVFAADGALGAELNPAEPEVEPEEEPEQPAPGSKDWVDAEQDWAYQWIEFKGDKLAVRKPNQQALAAYSLSASQFVSPEIQNDISGLFMAQHMSRASYLRVMWRFMVADDPDYNEEAVGDLMKMVVELATSEMAENNRAARRAASKAT